MKEKLTLPFILILSIMFLASCSLSVTKRQYRNGYHVEWNGKEKVKLRTIASVEPGEDKVQNSVSDPEISPQIHETDEVAVNTPTEPEHVAMLNSPVSNHLKAPGINAFTLSQFSEPVKNGRHLISKPVVDSQDDPRGIGGILWVLILILVVLWLIGLLVGGIGNALHILLVVALVLLLLRLISVL